LPSGRKTFYFRHYDQEKKNQRLKIGTFGNIPCETAREISKSLAGDLARGKDPKREKSEKTSQKILFCEFFELYTQRHRLMHHKPSTLKVSEYIVRRYILPFFGSKNLNDIAAEDIITFKELLRASAWNLQ
jgi:hypothetical protein